MIKILKTDRSPEYHGYVAKNSGQSMRCNPYPENDENDNANKKHTAWINGYLHGELVESLN